VIEKERIPVFPDLQTHGAKLGIAVRDVVLDGGEEYALLFTSTLRESELSRVLGRRVYAMGRLTAARVVMLREDGGARPLPAHGFDHFEPS
jgi:thiamine monophosphate kinase